jgi:hypothetical protein
MGLTSGQVLAARVRLAQLKSKPPVKTQRRRPADPSHHMLRSILSTTQPAPARSAGTRAAISSTYRRPTAATRAASTAPPPASAASRPGSRGARAVSSPAPHTCGSRSCFVRDVCSCF